MMNTFSLLADIRDQLKANLINWRMASEPVNGIEDNNPPEIYIGNLPPKNESFIAGSNQNIDSLYKLPVILIRATDGQITKEQTGIKHLINVAIIALTYSGDSFDLHERGVCDIMNLNDRNLLTLNDRLFWANDRYCIDENSLSWSLGLPKTIDPYEAGIQADAPYFCSVILTSFYQVIPRSQAKTNLITGNN